MAALGGDLSGILEVGICKVLKRRYLFVLFCFVFLPELPRAADQNVCKQSWAAQAELCYRKCLFPAKTEITASRPFICLHIPTSKIPGSSTTASQSAHPPEALSSLGATLSTSASRTATSRPMCPTVWTQGSPLCLRSSRG